MALSQPGEVLAEEYRYAQELVSREEYHQRVGELAREVIDRYEDQDVIFISVLKGAVKFTSDLMSEVDRQSEEDYQQGLAESIFETNVCYVQVKSYDDEDDPRSPKEARITIPLDETEAALIEGKLAVIVDDGLDSGGTPHVLEEYLYGLGATNVELVVAVEKQLERVNWPHATIAGFLLPKEWLTGIGLDDKDRIAEGGRWMARYALALASQQPSPVAEA